MYRLIERYRSNGRDGLTSKKIGNRNRSYGTDDRQRITKLVRELYTDFGPTMACEKLEEVHRIKVSPETLRKWMMAEGLWTDRAGRQPRIYSPRKPRERRGELVQVDGSYHRWFEKRGPEACLLVFIDDATSEILQMQMVDHESSFNYMLALKRYIGRHGRPRALYADRHSIFRATNPDGNGHRRPTQFSRACADLGIQIICAYSPQAKGRVERANRTLQDRLIKEMRLRNISTMEQANRYLPQYIADHNKRFARRAAEPEDAHLSGHNLNLDALLTYTVQRKVFKDLSVSFNKIRYLLEDNETNRKAIGKRVSVVLRLDGQLDIMLGETTLLYHRTFDKMSRIDETMVVDRKRLGTALALAKCLEELEPHHFQRAHVVAGFRKLFAEPQDPTSVALRNAPASVREKHRGRARAPLKPHPIIVLRDRLEKYDDAFGGK
jgi:hypothetical protein